MAEEKQDGWILGNSLARKEQEKLDRLVYTLRELESGLNELSKALKSLVETDGV